MVVGFAILPDWDSIVAVRSAHNVFAATALVFFALLVIFDVLAHIFDEPKERAKRLGTIALGFFALAVLAEIVAYPYSRQNDLLSDAQDELQKLRIADSNARAQTAELETQKLRAAMANRELTAHQQRQIALTCAVLAGKLVSLRTYPNDVEADSLSRQIEASLAVARVIASRGKIKSTWGDSEPVFGIHVVAGRMEASSAKLLAVSLRDDGGLLVEPFSPSDQDSAPIQANLVNQVIPD